MIFLNSNEIEGKKASPPYERVFKRLISPTLQKEVQNVAVGLVDIPPNSKSQPHIHIQEEETWFVINGRGIVKMDEEEVDVSKNTIIFVPPGKKHQLINTGDDVFSVLCIFTPPPGA